MRANDADLAPLLIRQAGHIFPSRLPELDTWTPPWQQAITPPTTRRTAPPNTLLKTFPRTTTALAALISVQ